MKVLNFRIVSGILRPINEAESKNMVQVNFATTMTRKLAWHTAVHIKIEVAVLAFYQSVPWKDSEMVSKFE
jgi:hypothetical protein